MDIRYQPKGGMCAKCFNRSSACIQLPFENMRPILDEYTDYSGKKPVNVLIVKCESFKRRPAQPVGKGD